MNSLENRYYTMISIFIGIGLIFIFRLFYIQVIDDKYKEAAQGNFKQEVIEYPYRGLIYDRKGNLLVYNQPIFDLMVVPNQVVLKDSMAFCNLLGISKEVLIENLKAARDYAIYKPSIFYKQISVEEMAKIQEHLIFYPGFYPQERTIRKYSYASMPHVLGYIREIDKKQLEKRKAEGYNQGDYIGIEGLEAYYEEALRGKRGKKILMHNVKGIVMGPYANGKFDEPSVAGLNLTTTIDIDLQQYAESLFVGKVGSAIAIEPKTGEILSFVSAPGFDPNLLTGREFAQNYQILLTDTNKVMFNRAIMADQYPPGSIFKTAQGLVALQEKVITPQTRFPCNRGIISCHGDHSNEDLRGAFEWSCNPYFWNVFKRIVNQDKSNNKYYDTELGLANWKEYMMSFGFGAKLGIDLNDEKSGQIPGVDLYNKIYGKGRWKFSTIYSLSIGQGEIGISPLQMANFAALLANKGYYYTPHLVKSIGKGDSILPRFTKKHISNVDTGYFKYIHDGMEDVVNFGTAPRARLDSIIVCGKTGTSQNPHGEDHSVFIAFAPRYNPQIAIAVYVENAGQGGRSAASIAGLIIEKYLNGHISKRRKYIEDYVYKNDFIY